MRRATILWVLPLLAMLTSACGSAAPPSHSGTVGAALRGVHTLPGHPPDLDALDFISPTNGWVGGNGIILGTQDSGATWQAQYLGPGVVIALDAVRPNVAFAATSAGLLAMARDHRWNIISPLVLSSLDFLSPTSAFALRLPSAQEAVSGLLLETGNGGRTWHAVSGAPALASICFYTPSRGLGLPADGSGVLATGDGGHTWTKVLQLSGLPNGDQLRCSSDGGGWYLAAGWASMSQQPYAIYRSAHYGQSWRAVAANRTAVGPAPGDPAAVPVVPGSDPGPLAAPSAKVAYVAGQCPACDQLTLTVSGTTDGGRTWSPGSAPIPLGSAGSAALDFVSAVDGWLLENPYPPGRSVILHTSDGGQTWHSQYSSESDTPTFAVAAVSRQLLYGLGTPADPSAVLISHDGGKTWHRVGDLPSGAGQSANALAFPTDRHGFAVTQEGLLETRNGGRSWRPASLGFVGPSVAAVAFANPQVGCVQLSRPADFVTRNAGRTWRISSSSLPAALCAAMAGDPALGVRAKATYDRFLPKPGNYSSVYVEAVALAKGSVWIGVTGTPGGGQLYVVARASTFRVTWPVDALSPIGIAPVDGSRALLWTSQAQLFETPDAGRGWQQFP